MAKVDSKGRVVLPKDVREALGITPGTEVDIHEEDGKAVVEPETDPEMILERMDELVAATAGEPSSSDDADPVARKHRRAIRRGAERDADE